MLLEKGLKQSGNLFALNRSTRSDRLGDLRLRLALCCRSCLGRGFGWRSGRRRCGSCFRSRSLPRGGYLRSGLVSLRSIKDRKTDEENEKLADLGGIGYPRGSRSWGWRGSGNRSCKIESGRSSLARRLSAKMLSVLSHLLDELRLHTRSSRDLLLFLPSGSACRAVRFMGRRSSSDGL